MTPYFIIAAFLFIIVYDIFLLLKSKKTVSDIMRGWYQDTPVVPFMVGVVWVGHFLNYIDLGLKPAATAIGLTLCGGTMIAVSVVLRRKKIILPKWVSLLLILVGGIAGDLLW